MSSVVSSHPQSCDEEIESDFKTEENETFGVKSAASETLFKCWNECFNWIDTGRRKQFSCAYAMFRFHANASTSASARKGKI